MHLVQLVSSWSPLSPSGPSTSSSNPAALNCYPHGPYWTHFTVNPYADIMTDPDTGSISPWYAV